MSEHAREQIRNALTACLSPIVPAGGRIFKSRTTPVTDAEMPCILIYTRAERSAFDAMDGQTPDVPLGRQLQIMVVGCVAIAASEPDDQLDLLAAEVEIRVAGSTDLAGLVQNLELLATDFDVPADTGDRRAGRVGLTWRCDYRTPAADPTTFV